MRIELLLTQKLIQHYQISSLRAWVNNTPLLFGQWWPGVPHQTFPTIIRTQMFFRKRHCYNIQKKITKPNKITRFRGDFHLVFVIVIIVFANKYFQFTRTSNFDDKKTKSVETNTTRILDTWSRGDIHFVFSIVFVNKQFQFIQSPPFNSKKIN